MQLVVSQERELGHRIELLGPGSSPSATRKTQDDISTVQLHCLPSEEPSALCTPIGSPAAVEVKVKSRALCEGGQASARCEVLSYLAVSTC
jgi:hypothetical protein